MRTLIVLAALLTPAVALADDPAAAVAGTFDVKFEEVTSNCQGTGMSLNRGLVTVERKKATAITIDIERIPLMTGTASKGGRIKATSRIGKTSIQGLDGRFSTAGTVNDDVLSVVFVAEYYLQGKAFCTQSWNVSGLRKTATAPAPAPSPRAALDAPWDLGLPLE